MNLESVWAVIRPDQQADPVTVSSGIYAELDAAYEQFRGHALVAMHRFTENWGLWEIHPHGDEVVVLLSGSARLILRQPKETSIALEKCGDFVLVPRNTWHTAQISEPTQMLFITPGEGTRNEREPP